MSVWGVLYGVEKVGKGRGRRVGDEVRVGIIFFCGWAVEGH